MAIAQGQTPETAPNAEGAGRRGGRGVRATTGTDAVRARQPETPAPESAHDEFVGSLGRIPILDLTPSVDGGRWPAKAFSGEVVPFTVTAFREGHDQIGVDLLLLDPDGRQHEHRMAPGAPGSDRWETSVQLAVEGVWRFRVQAYGDDFASWLRVAEAKVPAGVDLDLTFRTGTSILEQAAADGRRGVAERRYLEEIAGQLADELGDPAARLLAAQEDRLRAIMHDRPVLSLPTLSETLDIVVERQRAGVGGWYEFFPRSEGAKLLANGTWRSGTFRTAAKRLPEVAAMGFDVVYLPPIHPIGETNRKGRNNALTAEAGEPGSPWAIGSAAGGHDAIHPDLGDEDDFAFFIGKAKQAGLEVALDFALQAAPDHPWVTEHPEWFTTLPDGSIAYAENPPKKYQDIYPVNFDNDPVGIRLEALRLLRLWIERGVRIFRVDNPHTKPAEFWEWLIHTVNEEHPDIVFLAEAFTRPAVMQTLAKAGFQQSYSYFTWRNTKEELAEFLTQVSHETSDFMRPNLFVNTPDILTEYLQFGGPAAFRIRAAIAATAAPLWGVYSGFELYENVAREGAEEYIDNEKYEYRPRDYVRAQAQGASLAPYLVTLNQIRGAHPALRQLRNLTVHPTDDESILAYSKYLPGRFTRSGRPDAIIVVVNVDPHSVRESMVHIDPTAFGLAADASYEVRDLISGARWTWGADNYVRLDAFAEPTHILQVRGEEW